jgi:hypothetical protein
MNGSDFYQFGKVKEIWESRDGQGNKYVMCDGTILFFTFGRTNKENDQEMKMVYQL